MTLHSFVPEALNPSRLGVKQLTRPAARRAGIRGAIDLDPADLRTTLERALP